MLTRHEVTRVVGLRALQLSHGDVARVFVARDDLRNDMLYVAALELYEGRLDALVRRPDGSTVHTVEAQLPPHLLVLLDTRDGGSRMSPFTG
jgi:DNA-directed RNA polymerase subunit K/omega